MMLSESDSINGLIWASASGWLVTMFMVVGQRILDLHEAMDAWIEGAPLGPCLPLYSPSTPTACFRPQLSLPNGLGVGRSQA